MSKKITLDFIGKDSVHLKNEYEVPNEVYKVLKELSDGKKSSDRVFSVGSGDVEGFLREVQPDITPKLFRTAWGTKLLAEELQKHPINNNMTDFEKKAIYNNAALEVARKLNHQRNVAKTYKDQTEKLNTKLKEAKERNKETTEKSKQQLEKIKEDIIKIKSKYKGQERKERLAKLEDRREKIQTRLERSKNKIEKTKIDIDFKKNSKNLALGTAKSAYSSPQIAYSWCKSAGLPIDTVYPKTLQSKYEWASDTSEDYWSNFPNV